MRRSFILVLVGAVALTVGCVTQEAAPPAPAADASAAAVPTDAQAPAAAPSDTAAPAAASAPAARPAPSAAPAPKTSVSDLPDYPGAVRVAFAERTEAGKEFTRKAEAEWTSTDPYAKVVEYYQKAVVDRGWAIAGTKTKKTEIEWQLTKGTSVGTVEIKDGAPVTIKIERKDR
jgi:hypothetical protein